MWSVYSFSLLHKLVAAGQLYNVVKKFLLYCAGNKTNIGDRFWFVIDLSGMVQWKNIFQNKGCNVKIRNYPDASGIGQG